jgi:hypothetical protein
MSEVFKGRRRGQGVKRGAMIGFAAGLVVALILVAASGLPVNWPLSERSHVMGKVEIIFYERHACWCLSQIGHILDMMLKGWRPYALGHEGGIMWLYITHNIITNAGQDFTQHKLFDSAGAPTTFAQYIALSTDATAPSYTDTTLTGEITTGGLARAQATFTAGTAANGDVTARLSATFTAAAAFTGVQKAGLFTASTGGVLFAENTFPAVNLQSGDQLTINWDISYTN